MPAQTEMWIQPLQYEYLDGGQARRLTPVEVHQRVLERRAEWLARDLDRRHDEARIAAALEADPDLAAAFEPHALHGQFPRYGIVLDDALRQRLLCALRP